MGAEEASRNVVIKKKEKLHRPQPTSGTAKDKVGQGTLNRMRTPITYDKKNYSSVVAAPVVDVLPESPPYCHRALKAYQLQGLNWLINLFATGKGGILGDETRVGKIIQTIAFFGYLKFHKGIRTKCLVILQESEVATWKREIERWCPGLRHIVGLIDGNSEQMELGDQVNWDILFVTHTELVLNKNDTLKKIQWMSVVIDQADQMKSEHHHVSKAVTSLGSGFRLLLTETALMDTNFHQLRPLLNYVFSSLKNFAKYFDDWIQAETDTPILANFLLQKLRGAMEPYYLRRSTSSVETPTLKSSLVGDAASSAINNEINTWSCPNCHYKLYGPDSRLCFIKRHLQIHENPKHYCKYPGCSANFNCKTTMTKHWESRHGVIGSRVTKKRLSVVCPECSEPFSATGALNRHRRNVHERGGNHRCMTCQATFRTKGRLTTHQQITGH